MNTPDTHRHIAANNWLHGLGLAAVLALSLSGASGCDESPPDACELACSDDGQQPTLPPEMCGLTCQDGPPPPSGIPDDACYDGCNWCLCTADGLECTARGCPDAGPDLDAGPIVLPAEMCQPACSADGPAPPAGRDPETTCYDGESFCTCTSAGPVDCAEEASPDGGAADAGL